MPHTPQKVTGLLICTPTHSGQVAKEYTKSLLELQRSLDAASISSEVLIEESSLLHSMRNMMASLLLSKPELSHILFIDADMGFLPDAVMRMIDANVDVIGAVYPYKKLPLQYQLDDAEPTESLGEWIGKHIKYAARGTPQKYTDDIYEFEAVGTGLMLISKHSLRTISRSDKMAEYKKGDGFQWYYPSCYYGFFDFDTIDGFAVGEDYAFCLRWSAEGGKIYGLVSERIRHVGTNVVAGRYADHKSLGHLDAQSASSSRTK